MGPVPYDLVNPPPLKPREATALRQVARTVADALSALASDYLGARFDISLSSASGTATQSGATGNAAQSLWVFPDGMATAEAPVWRFDWPLASSLLDLMIAAGPRGESRVLDGVTKLERRLLAHLCRELYLAWVAAWPDQLILPESWRCIKGSADLEGPDPDDWVKVAFEMSGGRAAGGFDVHLPVDTARIAPSDDDSVTGSASSLDNPEVKASSVLASVRLTNWRTTVADLLSVEVGDVIPLAVSPGEPLTLSLAGLEKLTVRPGTHDGRISVQVADRERLDPAPGFPML